jgi:predicted nucleic acid-binding protein
VLLDSNIIIYAAQPDYAGLRAFIAAHAPAVSAVSVVEVLGYHGLSADDRAHFEAFFQASRVLAVSEAVIEEAVRLRQARKMTLGDALIAGTALTHGLTLVTHNVRDFEWVPGLRVLDPLSAT